MAKQKHKNSKALGEEEVEEDGKEEMPDLNTICSESTFETENLEVLEGGGHLTPEGESSRLLTSEKSWVELDGSHTVTCTFTVSLAVPVLPTGQKQKKSNPPGRRGTRIQVDESGAIPRMQRCYHVEYFLLPADLVPRKLDLVVFGVVAKLFTESDSKAITPWFENDKMWLSWNHSVDISVTTEYLIKLRDHKIILKIWDTKDKVSSKAKLSIPNIISSPEEDAEAVGEKLVVSRLAEDNPKVLDAYVTFTVETPLLSERQRHELNPLTIKINSATCLPNTPVPIEVLQRLCVPTYCKYKFHNFPPHRTHGQIHGTHVYFKDVNVLLTGTMKPGELQRYLRGPPLEIEVHDRDRNMENNTKKPCLFGEDEADEKLGKVSFLACESVIYNSFMKNEVWHPHGVAKVSLTDLLLGRKYLSISAPIRNCSAPNRAALHEEEKNEKITESVGSPSLLPGGHYLESDSLLKVRVEIAVPLGMHAEIADAQVKDCPYGCIIYIFDYKNSSLLHDLVEEITEINAKALQLDCYPAHLIGMALAALKLKTTLEKVSELDIVTGFHLLDGATHLFVLEGLKDKAIKKLWDKHFERTYRREDGQLEILYNSQLSFRRRLYTDLEAIFYHFRLCKPLFTITKEPLLYVRGMIPWACFQALSRWRGKEYDVKVFGGHRCDVIKSGLDNVLLDSSSFQQPTVPAGLSYLCHSKRLRDVVRGDLLPSAVMITVLSHEYGVPLTDEDLFTQKPPLLLVSSDDYTVPGKVSRVKQTARSSLDNHNERCVQRKKDIADKMSFERNHVEANIRAVCQLKGKTKEPKFEIFRISPVDGKSVFNYSCQSLNSAELAKKHLRQEMAKEPKNIFAYCHEYLSATFDPLDVVAACKESCAKSKSMWLSPDGFVFPGFKSSIESNLHPHMPDKARLEELSEKWQENALHANLEPVLSRDRWSWDKRHIDFDLYKKPPELFMTAAPWSDAKQILQTTLDDTKPKAHRRSTAAELPTRGPRARFQLQKLQGLPKDEPLKFSLGKAGPVLKPPPALPVLDNQPCDSGSNVIPGKRSITSGFVPAPADRHSLKWRKNVIPWHNRERETFEKLQGADFKRNNLPEKDAPPSSHIRQTLSRTIRENEVVLDTGNLLNRKHSTNSR
ncbi:PREDICTED: uncharacterized protein FLJ43738 [Phaethon lepturus]|uniref:uncharacterized protein FLJ43738 n=1 Tax=Phaethon lepturus TaxID=97097 RepID=UPI000530BA05|nr:PREDICTED: uncharacterized protein FLJ43738 [Phaethon lepturus]